MSTDGLFTREEAEVFAQGLLYVAAADGEAAEERALILAFLKDSGHGDLGDLQPRESFRPVHISCLSDSHQRQVFIKVALALVSADRKVSRAEVDALYELAEALGMGRELVHLSFDESLSTAALGSA